MEFKRWILELIGEQNYRRLDSNVLNLKLGSHDREGPAMRELMRSFDEQKKGFTTNFREMRIDLPKPLDKLNLDTRVRGGEIVITK